MELHIEPIDGHFGGITPSADDEPDVEEVDLGEEVLGFALGIWGEGGKSGHPGGEFGLDFVPERK